MNVIDKALLSIAPGAAVRRADARKQFARLEAEEMAAQTSRELLREYQGRHTPVVKNTGYSHGGASRRKTSVVRWKSESGSAKKDIEKNRKLLRERTRDLHMNSPLAAASINSTRTNCVGAGLRPNPKIDHEFLGISRDAARKLERLIKREFALWAESTFCDNNDQNNFYELQQIVFNDWLRNGEEFVLLKYEKEVHYMPYQLRLKLVEADRVYTPGELGGDYYGVDKKLKNGNFIVNGVEIRPDGKVEAYHIASCYPNEDSIYNLNEWTRVEKRGKRTGNANIIHVFNGERADQYRGVPFLAPVLESLKQLTRYTEAEIMAAVVNSLFTIFVTTETGNDMGGFAGEDDAELYDDEAAYRPEPEEDEIELGVGTINYLKTGEAIHPVESTHPSTHFDSFVNAMCNHIGAALEISPEIMLKKFSNNFSASKGAMNETWKAFQMRRSWFVNDFCQSVYELWFNEAVSKGRINAPGYFTDPLMRQAYLNVKWNGPAQGHLNPQQEVSAAVLRIQNGLSTHEDECTSMNGSNFEDNVRTLQAENEMLRDANGEEASGEDSDNDSDNEDDFLQGGFW